MTSSTEKIARRTRREAISARMAAVRQRHTTPEKAVQSLVNSLGFRYRTCSSTLPGRPDISNRKKGWCIFVHGCFWHGHNCKRGRLPRVNLQFWEPKIDRNRRRDEIVARQLRARGLRVLTVWQCELRQPEKVQSRLRRFFKRAGDSV